MTKEIGDHDTDASVAPAKTAMPLTEKCISDSPFDDWTHRARQGLSTVALDLGFLQYAVEQRQTPASAAVILVGDNFH